MGSSVTSKILSPLSEGQTTLRTRNTLISSPTIHRLWFCRGKVMTRQGYYEAALASFEAALKLQPNHHQTWMYRGVVLTHLERYKAALTSFNRALEICDRDREAWLFRGAVLKYLNRHQEALFSYSKALKLQKQDSEICQDYPLWFPLETAVLDGEG